MNFYSYLLLATYLGESCNIARVTLNFIIKIKLKIILDFKGNIYSVKLNHK